MMRPVEPLVTDRVDVFDLEPTALWTALTATDRYTTWWPWLREFDGTTVTSGQVWHCAIRSPLGYRVCVTIRLDEVQPPHHVRAIISGDVVGRAAIVVDRAGSGTSLRLVSHLTPVRPLLRRLTRWAPWVARRGHDHIVRTGLAAFANDALHRR